MRRTILSLALLLSTLAPAARAQDAPATAIVQARAEAVSVAAGGRAEVRVGLKVGQVMAAAIPISILAIGLARVYGRPSTLLENVIMTGIGGTSGAMVAGAIFTLPSLYILKLDPHPLQTTFISLAGGCLGLSS